ncbi:unnamed protein product [Adineta ricciae]|uniref:UBC core domain-containing protein n=1 Tax=Adineta ricciae TaxID=249248 RepID=A0A815GJQ5_ADIRI|nr:unnamed protein product [Adineta ricciae]
MAAPNTRPRRIHHEVMRFKNIGLTSNSPCKFGYEKSTLDILEENNQSLKSSDTCIMTGLIYPKSDIYKTGALRVEFELHPTYPLKAPKVYVRTKIYHPNVCENDEICTSLLSPTSTVYQATTSLYEILEEVTNVIDEPSNDLFQHTEAAAAWLYKREEYIKTATELYQKHFIPR